MGKEYHIKLNGELVPVTEEVYRAYQQPKLGTGGKSIDKRKRHLGSKKTFC